MTSSFRYQALYIPRAWDSARCESIKHNVCTFPWKVKPAPLLCGSYLAPRLKTCRAKRTSLLMGRCSSDSRQIRKGGRLLRNFKLLIVSFRIYETISITAGHKVGSYVRGILPITFESPLLLHHSNFILKAKRSRNVVSRIY